MDETVSLSAAGSGGSFLGRYELGREIGRGGMGVVYEARDAKLQRTVALKVVSAESVDAAARERFLREARAAAALNHPNIVAIHDAGDHEGRPFLVMEHVAGGSVADRPPASLEEALRLAGLVCDALEHAHARGLVHRDLKPGNILLDPESKPPSVKLTDMGIALARGVARVTRSGAFLGTPSYAAPEQALGREVDGRADLYSLGVMLYLWSTGRLPFEGDDALAVVSQHIHAPVVRPSSYRRDLPARLEAVILRLLEKDPDERFASAAEVREALAAVDLGEIGDATECVPIEALRRGHLVGRQDELGRLQELWTGVRDGGSHLALVSGEPGIGKTRLAHEVLASAQLDGALALTGGCYENEATTPYLPFVEAFRRLVKETADDRLREWLGDTAPEIARLAPEIEARFGPGPERPQLPPQEERLRLFDAVARFLRNLASRRGLCFFLDDLQWADHGSLALLHYLLRQLGSDPVFFLGTYREVELDRAHALSKSLVDWNRERLATRVRLDRLDVNATSRMIRTLLGQEEVSREFVVSLHRETEGNPFFVEEIVKALIAEGEVMRDESGWHRKSTGEHLLPQSVKAAIGSRLEQVDEACTEVLRTAAVLGKQFEFDELLPASRRGEDELLDALDAAARAQLIVAGRGESFAFTHDKIREVLYEELNPIRRRRVHARIAEGLEAMAEAGKDVAVEELAHHFTESGSYQKGLLYSERAAEAARAIFAWDEALDLLARARECAEALDLPEDVVRLDAARGEAAYLQGDVTAAAAHFERAIEAERDPERRNALRARCGEVCQIMLVPDGREYVRRVLDEVDPARQPGVAARAMAVEARYHHLDGRLEEAKSLYEKAIPLAEEDGDPHLLVRVYSYLAGTCQHRAEFAESDELAHRAIRLGEEKNVPEGILLGMEFLAENAGCRGFYAEAAEWSHRGRVLAREVQAGERLAWTYISILADRTMGRLDRAEEDYEESLEVTRRVGDRRLELFLAIVRHAVTALRGHPKEAVGPAEEIVREVEEEGLSAHRIFCRFPHVFILLALGRVEDAVREARAAIEVWREKKSDGMGVQGAVLAEALVRGGHLDEARDALDRMEEIAVRVEAAPRLAEMALVRGLLAGKEGRPEEALTEVSRAVDGLDAAGARIDVIRALLDRARLLDTAGRADEAAADRGRAAELAAECGIELAVLEAAARAG
jgi:tetratricopeptide (TPR) repeat protein